MGDDNCAVVKSHVVDPWGFHDHATFPLTRATAPEAASPTEAQ